MQQGRKEALIISVHSCNRGCNRLLAFSCRRRGFCPSCSAKRSVIWREFVSSQVLADCPHSHVTKHTHFAVCAKNQTLFEPRLT
ncbi:MAG: transposase zinc-binding domain-containing protein, partial [Acidobacteriota bacterium]